MTVVVTSPIQPPNLSAVGPIANPAFVPSVPGLFVSGITGLANIVTGSMAARRAGLRGVPLQAARARTIVLGAVSAIPGVGLLSVVEPIVRALGLKPTLPEFQLREVIENPDYIRGSARIELLQQQNVRSIQARQAAERAFAERLAAAEAAAAKQRRELIAARKAQSVRFAGVPGIFTRLRQEVA